jgi:hypothetical protein
MKKLMEVKEVLESIQNNLTQQKGTKQQKVSAQQEPIYEEKETVKTIIVGSTTFQIIQNMLQVDEDTMQKPLKDVEQLDLALSKIPTKALYKLQMSVAQEVQSRARTEKQTWRQPRKRRRY